MTAGRSGTRGLKRILEEGKLTRKPRKQSGQPGFTGPGGEKSKEQGKGDKEKRPTGRPPQRGRGRRPQQSKKADPAVTTGMTESEGTPLFGEETLQRPKGPVTPAEPRVIEIPAPTSAEKSEKAVTEEKKDKSGRRSRQPRTGKSTSTSKSAAAGKKPATSKPVKKDSTSAKPKSESKQVEKVEPIPPGVEKTTVPDRTKHEEKWVSLSDVPRKFPINIDQRVGIFVDVQNMFYTAKYKYNRKIDYKKLIEEISRDRKVVRALAYMVQAPEIDQTQFKTILDKLGFELRIKDLRVRADGTAKGDWDMGIAIDSISMKEKLDVVALVSGDGDFTDLVYMLRSNGLRVEVYSFPSNTSEDLIEAATYYYPMEASFLMKW